MSDKGMTERQALGRMGEDAAARLYTDAGYRVIERNRHESHNEIDLILENATSLVFVEVKTRTQSPGTRPRFGRPASAVDAGKQPRIDVVEVYVGKAPDGTPTVLSVLPFRNAFGAGK